LANEPHVYLKDATHDRPKPTCRWRRPNEAGEAAWPDDVSARFLKLDDIKIRHFRAAARACEQEAETEAAK
jgi:hypothetical protein